MFSTSLLTFLTTSALLCTVHAQTPTSTSAIPTASWAFQSVESPGCVILEPTADFTSVAFGDTVDIAWYCPLEVAGAGFNCSCFDADYPQGIAWAAQLDPNFSAGDYNGQAANGTQVFMNTDLLAHCYPLQTECFFSIYSTVVPAGQDFGNPLAQVGLIQLDWLTYSGAQGGLVNDTNTWGALPSMTTVTSFLPVGATGYQTSVEGTVVVAEVSAGYVTDVVSSGTRTTLATVVTATGLNAGTIIEYIPVSTSASIAAIPTYPSAGYASPTPSTSVAETLPAPISSSSQSTHVSASGTSQTPSLSSPIAATTSSAVPPPVPVNKGAIAGGVVGGVLVLALLAGGFLLYNRRRKQEPQEHSENHDYMVNNNEAGERYHDIPKVPEMSSGQVMPTGVVNGGGNFGAQGQGRMSAGNKESGIEYVL